MDLPWDSFWERTDRGLNGHGILSRIAVTFRMVPSGNKRTWDRTDMGSLLGSNGPFVSTYFWGLTQRSGSLTRLASDLSRARQKVPSYCTKVRMYGTISRRPTTLAPTNDKSAWLNEEKNHIGKKMISQLSACEVIRVVSLDTNNQA
jgi:hypothetical protein